MRQRGSTRPMSMDEAFKVFNDPPPADATEDDSAAPAATASSQPPTGYTIRMLREQAQAQKAAQVEAMLARLGGMGVDIDGSVLQSALLGTAAERATEQAALKLPQPGAYLPEDPNAKKKKKKKGLSKKGAGKKGAVRGASPARRR